MEKRERENICNYPVDSYCPSGGEALKCMNNNNVF